ncbi:hypothetical protein CaCOL14_005136 [Colletotrichum acutatum]
MDIKWNLTVSERTEKLVSAGADLTILHEAQKILSPEVAERVADELTTEEQKEKVFEGIHCVAAVDSSSFAFETLVDMYLMSYKLNEDQKKAIENLSSEVKELREQIHRQRIRVQRVERLFDVFNLLQSFGWNESMFSSYEELRHPDEASIASNTELSPKSVEVITDIVRYLTLRNTVGAYCHCCGTQSLPMFSIIHMFELVRQLDQDFHNELEEICALLNTQVTGAEFTNQEDSD